MTESQIRQYLGLTKEQLASMDHDTLKTLMELKVESAREFSHDKDSAVNTAGRRYLLRPYPWSGYARAEYIWQPVSEIPQYNIVPLILRSLKVTAGALIFAVPLAPGAAIYVPPLGRPRV